MAGEAKLARWIPVAVAFSILGVVGAVLVSGEGLDWSLLKDLRPELLLAALAFHVMAHLFWAARMALIANAAGTRLHSTKAWATLTAGTFGGALTPGKVGGFGLNLAILIRRGIAPARASRILMADRASDLIFFVILGVVASILLPPLFGDEGGAARGLAMAGTASLAIFMLFLTSLMLWPRRTGRLVDNVMHGISRLFKKRGPKWEHAVHDGLIHVREGVIDVLGRRPSLAFAALLLTLANWVVEFAALWTVLTAFGYSVPYWMVFFVGVVLFLVGNIPISPGGAGVVEVAGIALLAPVVPNISPLVVVVWRGLTYDYDLLVGGATAGYLLSRRTNLKPSEADEPLCA